MINNFDFICPFVEYVIFIVCISVTTLMLPYSQFRGLIKEYNSYEIGYFVREGISQTKLH